MSSIITNKMRVKAAQLFKELFSDEAVYMFIGREGEWLNVSSSSSTAATATDSVSDELNHWYNMIGMKKVSYSNVTHVIERKNWASGTTYDQYDDTDTNLFNQDFYVLTDEMNVYKCIYSPGTPSTEQPSGYSTGYITTDDDYIWKYMYSVSEIDQDRFLTTDWMPVSFVTDSDCACEELSRQLDVQEAAVPGEISVVMVTTGGTGYSDGTAISVSSVDGGSGLAGTVVVSGGVIQRITLSNRGSGYSQAPTITVSGGTGATFRVIMSPSGGHGADARKELGARWIMARAKLRFDEDDIPTENEYRKIGLVLNPVLKNSTYGSGNVGTAVTYNQCVVLEFSAAQLPAWTLDSRVTQASAGAAGKVVQITDETNANGLYEVWLTEITKTFSNTGTVSDGSTTKTPTTATVYEMERGIGDILYIEQREPITRQEDQSEDLRVIITF